MVAGLFAHGVLLATLVVSGPPPPRVGRYAVPTRRQADELDNLRPAPGGGYTYRDEEAGLEAVIKGDGTVEFRELRPKSSKVKLPGVDWFEGFAEALIRPPGQRDRPDLEAQNAPTGDTGIDAFTNAETIPWGPYGQVPMATAGFPLPGLWHLLNVGNQRRRAKRDFMRKTAGLRAALTARARELRIRRALAQLGNQLTQLWKDDRLSLAERKRRLFKLWDDCADDKTGERARLRIERFIRTVAPDMQLRQTRTKAP